jgi:C4-type Zn-finger protein
MINYKSEDTHPIHPACGLATDECVCGQVGDPCPKCGENMVFELPERKQPYREPYFLVCMCYACGYKHTDDLRDGR